MGEYLQVAKAGAVRAISRSGNLITDLFEEAGWQPEDEIHEIFARLPEIFVPRRLNTMSAFRDPTSGGRVPAQRHADM